MTKLETIQKVFGVFKIIAKIGMIVCYVVAGLAIAGGIIYLSNGEVAFFKLGDTTIYLPFVYHLNANTADNVKIGWTLLSGGLGALFEGILLTFAYRYFSLEQKEGTPFTENGAKSLLKLGILSIVLSAVEASVRCVIYKIVNIPEAIENFSSALGVILGVCLILFSIVAKYGAELEQKCKKADASLPADKTTL